MKYRGDDELALGRSQGIAARRAQVPLDANPHEPRSDLRVGWAEGWHLAAELHSGDPDDEACRACGLYCWEMGGCELARPMQRAIERHMHAHGGPRQEAADKHMKAAMKRFRASVDNADPRDLVKNRRSFLEGHRG